MAAQTGSLNGIGGGAGVATLLDNTSGFVKLIKELIITNKSGASRGVYLIVTDASNTELSRPIDDAIVMADGESLSVTNIVLLTTQKLRWEPGGNNVTAHGMVLTFDY